MCSDTSPAAIGYSLKTSYVLKYYPFDNNKITLPQGSVNYLSLRVVMVHAVATENFTAGVSSRFLSSYPSKQFGNHFCNLYCSSLSHLININSY